MTYAAVCLCHCCTVACTVAAKATSLPLMLSTVMSYSRTFVIFGPTQMETSLSFRRSTMMLRSSAVATFLYTRATRTVAITKKTHTLHRAWRHKNEMVGETHSTGETFRIQTHTEPALRSIPSGAAAGCGVWLTSLPSTRPSLRALLWCVACCAHGFCMRTPHCAQPLGCRAPPLAAAGAAPLS